MKRVPWARASSSAHPHLAVAAARQVGQRLLQRAGQPLLFVVGGDDDRQRLGGLGEERMAGQLWRAEAEVVWMGGWWGLGGYIGRGCW